MRKVRELISDYVNENFHVSFMLIFYFDLTNVYSERPKIFEEYVLLFFLTFLAYNYLRKKNFATKKQLNRKKPKH